MEKLRDPPVRIHRMRAQHVPLARALRIALVCLLALTPAWSVPGALASEAPTADAAATARATPVMFVHGYAPPLSSAIADVRAYFGALPDYLRTQKGWTGQFEFWGYYACDGGTTSRVDNHPRAAPGAGGDPHRVHYHSHENGAYASGPPRDTDEYVKAHGSGCGGHDKDTPIEHLAYHWAWAVHDKYTSKGLCVSIVAHSMGGVIARYALARVQHRHPDFPPALCAPAVITFGTPHAGSHKYTQMGNTYQASQLGDHDSPFLTWLAAHARNPQGSTTSGSAGATYWTVVGSRANVVWPGVWGDTVVSDTSATGMDAARKVVYRFPTMKHSFYFSSSWNPFTDEDGWNQPIGARASVTDLEALGGTHEARSAPWPNELVDQALTQARWGCGGLDFNSAQPRGSGPRGRVEEDYWPLRADVPVSTSAFRSYEWMCRYKITVPQGVGALELQMQSSAGVPRSLRASSEANPYSRCASSPAAQTQRCIVTSPAPGTWVVSVSNPHNVVSDFTLMAKFLPRASGSAQPRAGSQADVREVASASAGGVPDAPMVWCARSSIRGGDTVDCSFSSRDPTGGGVHYLVNWGDGSSLERVPAEGTTAPAQSTWASHTFIAQGTRMISVTPFSATGAQGPSGSGDLRVEAPNRAPDDPAITCDANTVGVTQEIRCQVRGVDADGDGMSHLLDWGDGTSTRLPATGYAANGATLSATHAYAVAGGYDLSVNSRDERGLESATMVWGLNVTEDAALAPSTPPPSGPSAPSLSCPQGVAKQSRAITCAARSNHPDPDAGLRYQFVWGDGRETWDPEPSDRFYGRSERAFASHIFDEDGEFDVVAYAWDHDDRRSPSSAIVHARVANKPPVVPEVTCATGWHAGGVECTITSSDPNDDPFDLTLAWEGSNPLEKRVRSGQSVTVKRVYNDVGPSSITARARDVYGAQSAAVTVAFEITEPNHAPSAPAVSCAVGWHAGGVECAATSEDEDGDGITYTFAFQGHEPVSASAPSGETVNMRRVYNQAGPFEVAVTARDGYEGMSTVTQVAFTITEPNLPPAAPFVDCFPKVSVVEQPTQCSASTTDPEGDALVYFFEWGDGTGLTRAPTGGYVPSGQGRGANHTYTWVPYGGVHTVRVHVLDEWSARSDTSQAYAAVVDPVVASADVCDAERAQASLGIECAQTALAQRPGWSAPGGGSAEPNSEFDSQEWMWTEPNANPEDRVYFNGFEYESFAWGGYGVGAVSPSSDVLATRQNTHALQAFGALLGLWRDCNGDGFIGSKDLGTFDYPRTMPYSRDICPDGSGFESATFVHEFRPLGPFANGYSEWNLAGGSVDVDARAPGVAHAVNDTRARVWMDVGRPEEAPPRRMLDALPFPRGMLDNGQAFFLWLDDQTGISSSEQDHVFALATTLNNQYNVLAGAAGNEAIARGNEIYDATVVSLARQVYAPLTGPGTHAVPLHEARDRYSTPDEPDREKRPIIQAWDCQGAPVGGVTPRPMGLASLGGLDAGGALWDTEEDATDWHLPSLTPGGDVNGGGCSNGPGREWGLTRYQDAQVPYRSLESWQGPGPKRAADMRFWYNPGRQWVEPTSLLHEQQTLLVNPPGALLPATGSTFTPMWHGERAVALGGSDGIEALHRGRAAQYYTFYARVGVLNGYLSGKTGDASIHVPATYAFPSGVLPHVYGREQCPSEGHVGAWDCVKENWAQRDANAPTVFDHYHLRDTDCVDNTVLGRHAHAPGASATQAYPMIDRYYACKPYAGG